MSRIIRLALITLLKSSAALAFATAISGCASNGNSVASLSPDKLARVQSTCQNVVGIAPSDATFDSCTRSLAGELASPAVATAATPTNGIKANYFIRPAGVELRRQEQACTSIGLHTGSDAFESCVADLNSALTNARAEN